MNAVKKAPKSCSCRSCKYGKATRAGNFARKSDERAYRHASKIRLKLGDLEDMTPAPTGGYYD